MALARALRVPPIDFAERKVAYFSMEIALAKHLPTYSGGLRPSRTWSGILKRR